MSTVHPLNEKEPEAVDLKGFYVIRNEKDLVANFETLNDLFNEALAIETPDEIEPLNKTTSRPRTSSSLIKSKPLSKYEIEATSLLENPQALQTRLRDPLFQQVMQVSGVIISDLIPREKELFKQENNR